MKNESSDGWMDWWMDGPMKKTLHIFPSTPLVRENQYLVIEEDDEQSTVIRQWLPGRQQPNKPHYSDVILSAMESLITTLTIVYSTVYSGADKKTSKLHVTGLCGGNSAVTGEFPHKGTVTKCFHSMTSSWWLSLRCTQVWPDCCWAIRALKCIPGDPFTTTYKFWIPA